MKKHASLAVFIAVLVLVPVVAIAQTNVRCESNGKMRQCGFSGIGTVQLSNQLSRNACFEGQTWGYSGNTIWVDRGCRADFIVNPSYGNRSDNRPYDNRPYGNPSYVNTPPSGLTIQCVSENNRRHNCVADTRFGVQLSRQLSSNVCVQGSTWGYTSNGVWVDRGCRAEFLVMNAPPPMASSINGNNYRGTLVCESKNNVRHLCRADTRFGVQLSRQLSDNNCDFGHNWGYDKRGVWVTRGCRAEFVLGH